MVFPYASKMMSVLFWFFREIFRKRAFDFRCLGIVILCTVYSQAHAEEHLADQVDPAIAALQSGIDAGEERVLPAFRFDKDSSRLTPEGQALIIRFAELLISKGADDYRVAITGHADANGPAAFNEGLALSRARAVETALETMLGPDHRLADLTVEGRGSQDLLPDVPSYDPLNRRAEIRVTRLADTAPAPDQPDTPDMASAAVAQQAPLSPPPADWTTVAHVPANARMRFDGSGAGAVFDLPDDRFTATSRITVEAWFSPAWDSLLDHDPTIVSLEDGLGARVSVHILANRRGLAVWDGTKDNYSFLPYDFRQNKPYHLALSVYADGALAVIDGRHLAGRFPVGLGPSPVDRVRLGSVLGIDPFNGEIGGVRLFTEALAPTQAAELYSIPPDQTDIQAQFDFTLAAETRASGTGKGLDLFSYPRVLTPAEGWWASSGRADIRLHNAPDFLAGLDAPQFSKLQTAFADTLRGRTGRVTSSEDPATLANAADGGLHPHFSLHETYRMTVDGGFDAESLKLPERLQGQWQDIIDLERPGLEALQITMDQRGIVKVTAGTCPAEAIETRGFVTHCNTDLAHRAPYLSDFLQRKAKGESAKPYPRVNKTLTQYVLLAPEERVQGVSYHLTQSGRMVELLVYTTQAVHGPYGNRPREDAVAEQVTRMAPIGAAVTGLVTHRSQFSRDLERTVGLELGFGPDLARPALVFSSDAGDAVRFVRVGATTFKSTQARPHVLKPEGRPVIDHPTLEVLAPGRIVIAGIDVDLTLQKDRETAQRQVGFNDTFVSLSKAVNLEANYTGYDILAMDPLHLMDSGTHLPVFKMPSGAAQDYYDANRVFVPKGLHYVPEFTGRHHGTVHATETYSQFRDAHSETVSAGIDGKLAPVSFSFSARMSQAREAISQNKVTKTLGMTKAVFYDLVLDKQHMELCDALRDEVARLRDTGRYDLFIEAFGTHYPVAVIYGGLGVLEIDFTDEMRQSLLQDGVGLKMETGFLLDADTQTKASFGVSQDSEHAETFRNVVGSQSENFYWVGGTHAGAQHSSWSVGTDGVVPVHVALRPIDELFSPVYFPDDPDVSTRMRAELRAALETRLMAARKLLPREDPPDIYTIEVRMDRVQCSGDRNDQILRAGQVFPGSASYATPRVREIFPMLHIGLKGQEKLWYRDFAERGLPTEGTYQPIKVVCPSHADLIEKSSFLEDRRLARFQVPFWQLKGGWARLVFSDWRNLEHFVIYPLKRTVSNDNVTEEEAFWGGFFAVLTLGIKVGIDELSEEGSILVNDDSAPPVPRGRELSESSVDLFCKKLSNGCSEITEDYLDQIAGRWIKHSMVSRRAGCGYCVDYRIEYSVRVLK